MLDDFRTVRKRPNADKLPHKPAVEEDSLPAEDSKKIPTARAQTETGKAGTPEMKENFWHKLHARWQVWSKKEKSLAAAGAMVALGLVVFGLFSMFHKSSPFTPSTPAKKTATKPVPVTVASPLTGVQVDPILAARPVTAIMIENSPDARPQSGLQDAGVVFEAIAEGGVTRFVTLYQDAQPQYIGPVRSLRPYFLDFAAPFEASIAHVGGSPDALSEVRNGNYRDIDQFFNSDYYWREPSRPAPHNVYTSFAKLDALNQKKGYTTSHFTSWPRKKDAKTAVPSAKTINLTLSGPTYNVHYDYDASSNSYARSEGGAPHMNVVNAADQTGVQLKPKVVVALIMNYSFGALDASGAYYSDYTDTGTGQMYVFQDGSVIQGTWSKADASSQFQFADNQGQPIKLNAGQTWVTALASASDVSYSP